MIDRITELQLQEFRLVRIPMGARKIPDRVGQKGGAVEASGSRNQLAANATGLWRRPSDLVQLVQFQTHTQYVRLLTLVPVTVGRRHKGSVR